MTDSDALTACPDCDLLVHLPADLSGADAHCPRCNKLLVEAHKDGLQRAYWLSAFGLIIYFPAMVLPMLELHLLGKAHASSLGAMPFALYDSGHRITALIVTAMIVFAPLINLAVTFASVLMVKKDWPYTSLLLRINHHVRHWSMLEVFMMGVIVSVIKMREQADVILGPGLISYVCLMLITAALAWAIDDAVFWEAYDEHRSR